MFANPKIRITTPCHTKPERLGAIRARLAWDARPVDLWFGWPAVWKTTQLGALCHADCAQCGGTGRFRLQRRWRPCRCALRGAFRMVWKRFEAIRAAYPASSVTTEGMWTFGRKREEFLADVLLVAKRALSEADWRLFDLHFVRGLEWLRCCSHLGYSRGYFFHAVYRVQEALGRAWVEVQPFPLCPPSEYFSGRRMDTATLDSRTIHLAALRAAASGRPRLDFHDHLPEY
jgi:hypothetical protein